MTTWASEAAVEEAMREWTLDQQACRLDGHTWRPRTAFHRPGFYTITQRCSRCRNERERDIDEQGYPVTRWSIKYRKTYLLEGLGRVGQNGKALLRLESLRNMTIVEVEDE